MPSPIPTLTLTNADHIQVIAYVTAFYFGAIEQGGSSLCAALSQKVAEPEVLRVPLGIGGDEIAHFLDGSTSPATGYNNRSRP